MIGTFIDVGFAVILIITVLVGLAEGFSRQFSRPLCGLIAIFGAIGLTAFLYTIISPLSFYTGLEAKATALFSADFYSQQASDTDSLAAILSGGYLRILASSSEMIWTKMQAMNVTTLGDYFGKLLIKVAAQFLIWLVLYLAIKYLLFGIKYLMTKISRVVVFKSIDKIFGLVWSLAITYIIVISIVLTAGELVLGQFFPEIGNMVVEYIAQTSVVKFLHNTNVIGSFLADILGWSLLAL
ncbi:MAG: hypothetical protein J1F66_00845 [Clostridiales bacterium]|nr:hypothetical protein [Clostridiales bacterium]